MHHDGSLMITPERPGDAERLMAIFRATQEHEAAIAHGLCNVELVVKITFKSPGDAAKAAQLRKAAPNLARGLVLSSGAGFAKGG